MIIRFVKILLLYSLSITVVCQAIAQNGHASLNTEEVRSQARLANLLKAAELSQSRLEAAVKEPSLPNKGAPRFSSSPVAQMIYATHLYQVSANDPRADLLSSLPRTATEMEAFYEFTHNKGSEQFRPYYLAFYEAAFHLVAQRPKALPRIFDVATQFDTKIWPNYDDVDFFCSQLGELRKKMPAQYDRAARLRNSGDRKFLEDCGR